MNKPESPEEIQKQLAERRRYLEEIAPQMARYGESVKISPIPFAMIRHRANLRSEVWNTDRFGFRWTIDRAGQAWFLDTAGTSG